MVIKVDHSPFTTHQLKGSCLMQVHTERRGSVLIVGLEGSLDVITSQDAEKAVLEQIDHGEKNFVFDLGKLDYVSSAGIRMILAVLKRLKAVGGNARFCALIKPVKQVFDIAGLSFRVALFPTLQEALVGFPPPAPNQP